MKKENFQPTAWVIGRIESEDRKVTYKPFEVTSVYHARKQWEMKGCELTFLFDRPFYDEKNCRAAAKYLAKEDEIQAYRRLMKDVFPELTNDEPKIKTQDNE